MRKMNYRLALLLLIIGIGAFLKLLDTWGGNYLFNMDNARDFIDVREMISLSKFRLIGPTSGIEGFFNGPFWYYLLAIPYIITGGDPYSGVLLMVLLWLIGGVFLINITKRWGFAISLFTVFIWISSDFINLTTRYSYNPNPVPLLTPVLIFLLEKFHQSRRLLYGLMLWFLGGLFFNFEMAFGVFIPLIILATTLFSKNISFLKNKIYWLSIFGYLVTVLPQLLFEFKHNFFMASSLIKYIANSSGNSVSWPFGRLQVLFSTYSEVWRSGWFNSNVLLALILIFSVIIIWKRIRVRYYTQNYLVLGSLMVILIPFLGYLAVPVNVMRWHLGASVSALTILTGFSLWKLGKLNTLTIILSKIFIVSVIFLSLSNLKLCNIAKSCLENNDQSLVRNEIAAIDFVYTKAAGKDFKVYTYLPSVYDYPYQYLFWWYGNSRYGYVPSEYSYLPDKPEYIKQKDRLIHNYSSDSSEKIFLIKEPDDLQRRELWENNFIKYPLLNKTLVGPLEVETRSAKILSK